MTAPLSDRPHSDRGGIAHPRLSLQVGALWRKFQHCALHLCATTVPPFDNSYPILLLIAGLFVTLNALLRPPR